jgi:hypothetical protein
MKVVYTTRKEVFYIFRDLHGAEVKSQKKLFLGPFDTAFQKYF